LELLLKGLLSRELLFGLDILLAFGVHLFVLLFAFFCLAVFILIFFSLFVLLLFRVLAGVFVFFDHLLTGVDSRHFFSITVI